MSLDSWVIAFGTVMTDKETESSFCTKCIIYPSIMIQCTVVLVAALMCSLQD